MAAGDGLPGGRAAREVDPVDVQRGSLFACLRPAASRGGVGRRPTRGERTGAVPPCPSAHPACTCSPGSSSTPERVRAGRDVREARRRTPDRPGPLPRTPGTGQRLRPAPAVPRRTPGTGVRCARSRGSSNSRRTSRCPRLAGARAVPSRSQRRPRRPPPAARTCRRRAVPAVPSRKLMAPRPRPAGRPGIARG